MKILLVPLVFHLIQEIERLVYSTPSTHDPDFSADESIEGQVLEQTDFKAILKLGNHSVTIAT